MLSMKELKLALVDFDLSGFVGEILRFSRTTVSKDVDPSYAVVAVPTAGASPEYGEEHVRRDLTRTQTYSVTINAHDNTQGADVSVPIQVFLSRIVSKPLF
jgi:stress response protein YsnF